VTDTPPEDVTVTGEESATVGSFPDAEAPEDGRAANETEVDEPTEGESTDGDATDATDGDATEGENK